MLLLPVLTLAEKEKTEIEMDSITQHRAHYDHNIVVAPDIPFIQSKWVKKKWREKKTEKFSLSQTRTDSSNNNEKL